MLHISVNQVSDGQAVSLRNLLGFDQHNRYDIPKAKADKAGACGQFRIKCITAH